MERGPKTDRSQLIDTITRAWSQFREDLAQNVRSTKDTPCKPYLTAREGLTLLDIEDHGERSQLLTVAGLSQAFLASDKDEKSEPLLRESLKEAELSNLPGMIADAKNSLALGLISPVQPEKRWAEAIPLFSAAADIRMKLGQSIAAADSLNNLAQCHNAVGLHLIDVNRNQEAIAEHEKAVQCADKAIEQYKGYDSDESHKAPIRKIIALLKLGQLMGKKKPSRAEKYFKKAKRIVVKYPDGNRTDIQRKLGIIASQQRLALGSLQP